MAKEFVLDMLFNQSFIVVYPYCSLYEELK